MASYPLPSIDTDGNVYINAENYDWSEGYIDLDFTVFDKVGNSYAEAMRIYAEY